MHTKATLPILLLGAFVMPASAQSYPVSGKWGVTATSSDGAIDCTNKRVITFNGDQRTDSKGGVRAFRIRSVTPEGPANYRIVDVFTTGQISNAHTTYTLRQADAGHIEIQMQSGGTLKLQRCK